MDNFAMLDRFECEVLKGGRTFLERLWDRIKEAARRARYTIQGWINAFGFSCRLIFFSRWSFECYDAQGNLKWAEYDRPNIMTNEGLDFILNAMFHGTANVTKWYLALVESDTTAAATQTYAIPVYTECTAYTEAARPEFNGAAASSQSITNSANKASFTMNATKTLYGAALVGGGTGVGTAEIPGNTNDAAGKLMCYSKFTTAKEVENTDIFKCWCTITAGRPA
jgi:hypothetical protein